MKKKDSPYIKTVIQSHMSGFIVKKDTVFAFQAEIKIPLLFFKYRWVFSLLQLLLLVVTEYFF